MRCEDITLYFDSEISTFVICPIVDRYSQDQVHVQEQNITAIFFLSWFAVKFKDKAQILNSMARGKVENKKKEKSGEGEIL